MDIERIIVGPLEVNCYLAVCPVTREAAVIDPGGDARRILSRINALALRVRWIVNTHGHGDHIGANPELKAAFPTAQLAVHEADAEFLSDPGLNLSAMFGLPFQSPAADVLLKDGDLISVGNTTLRVIHVPGHTPGGIALYAPAGPRQETPFVISGDALFAGSIGRTDFPGGSMEQLTDAMRRRLLSLPPETIVYPGHGEPTTIGEEAQSNPFL